MVVEPYTHLALYLHLAEALALMFGLGAFVFIAVGVFVLQLREYVLGLVLVGIGQVCAIGAVVILVVEIGGWL